MADVKCVAADQIAAQLLDLRGDGAVAIVLAVGLAPSDHAGIGLDAQEHEVLAPAGVNRQALDARDFHDLLRPAAWMIGAQRAISSLTNAANACCPRCALSGTSPPTSANRLRTSSSSNALSRASL